MWVLRSRRRARAEREIRIMVPDARVEQVQARVARSVARLGSAREADALARIEAVADSDEDQAR